MLRHTFSVLTLQNSVDVKTLSAMLNHYSTGFTLDTYLYVTITMQTKDVNTVSNFLSGAVVVSPYGSEFRPKGIRKNKCLQKAP